MDFDKVQKLGADCFDGRSFAAIVGTLLRKQGRKPVSVKNKDCSVRGVLEYVLKEWTARFQQESGARIGQR